jgi:2-haloacid dehalogenase
MDPRLRGNDEDYGDMSKAVIFDIGQVLFRWDLRHLFAKLIADPAELERFVTTVITPEWHFQSDAGRPLDEMVAERIAEYPEHETLIRAYSVRFNETIPGPVEGMIALVEELHDAGVPMFVITNFGHEFWHQFRPTQPVFERFRDIVVSGTEKMAKPDPAIYRLALERFGLTADEALFIDDRADNIAGAESVGIVGHVFRDAAATQDWLRGQGLLPS